MSDQGWASRHIGRSFTGHPLEDDCPCPQESCGLVAADKVVDGCPQHDARFTKTIRQGHSPAECPGVDVYDLT